MKYIDQELSLYQKGNYLPLLHLKKNSDFSKDLISGFENKIQKLTDLYISKSDDLFKIKESDIMTV